MSAELYINERRVDLGRNTRIALTKQVNDLSTLKNRDASLSNQFKLPKSDENTRILGFAGDMTSDTNAPYRQMPARYLQDGIEIVSDGFAVIQDSDSDFNLVVYSGIVDFFQLLGDSKLADLDFSDLNHDWTAANAIASHANTSGYIYALCDWGVTPKKNNNLPLEFQYFSLFVHDIIDRIFTQRGWIASGSLIDHPFYQRLIFPFVNGELKSSAVADEKRFEVFSPAAGFVGKGNFLIYFDTIVHDPLGYFNILTRAWEPQIPIEASLKVTFRVLEVIVAQQVQVRLLQVRSSQVSDLAITTITPASVGNQLIMETDLLSFEPGDSITVQIINDGAGDFVTIENITLESIVSDKVFPGDEIVISENIHDMTQRKFLLNVLNMFAAIPDKIPYKNEVNIGLFNDIVDNKVNAPDWSDKIDFSVNPKLEYRIDKYAKINNIKYAEDDLLSEEIGTGQILVDDDVLEPEIDIINMDFGASESVFRTLDSINMAKLNLLEITDDSISDGYVDVRLLTGQSWVGNNDLLVQFDDIYDNDSGYFNVGTFHYQPLDQISVAFRFSFTITSINVGIVWGDIRIAIIKHNGIQEFNLAEFYPNDDNAGLSVEMVTDPIQLLTTDTVRVHVFLQSGDNITIAPGGRFETIIQREIASPKPRILGLKYQTFSGSYDDGINNNPFVSSIPIGYFEDNSQDFQLGFGSNLLEKFYDGIQKSLVKAKKLQVPMRITVNDFHDFDYFTPIYLNIASREISGYFYVNKIHRYEKNKTTRIDLIRL